MVNKFLSNSSLKLLALVFMLIDHIGATGVLINNESSNTYIIMRIIGRLAFPIFAFLITEGFIHTRNVKKYFLRLVIFAFISEIPFDLALFNKYLELTHQNIFFTLSLGLLTIIIFEHYKNSNPSLGYFYLFIIGFISILFRTDYSIFGIMMIFCFHLFRGNFYKISVSILIINFITIFDFLINFILTGELYFINIIQIFSVLSLFLIYFYNHKKGFSLKYIFYLFYPLHLLILYLVNIL